MSDMTQPAANNPGDGTIPYHQVYFGCCNRTVMTREDVAQPKYCPFCGRAGDGKQQEARREELLRTYSYDSVQSAYQRGAREMAEKAAQVAESYHFPASLGASALQIAKDIRSLAGAEPQPGLNALLAVAKVRLEEATNWHQFGETFNGFSHDADGWCCKREQELRDEVMALEVGGAVEPPQDKGEK